MKQLWKKWSRISKKIARVEADIILFIFYYIIIVPISLFIKLFFNNVLQSQQSVKSNASYWKKRKKLTQDFDFAREQ